MSQGHNRDEPFEGRLIAGLGDGLLASYADTLLEEKNLLVEPRVTVGGLMFSLREQVGYLRLSGGL